jgi:hypothetical protein
MAEAQQQLRKEKAGATTGKTAGKQAEGKPGRLRVVSRGRAPKDGVELLRQLADRRVGRISKRLADLLEAKALKGDLASTRVLVGLAERKKPVAQVEKKQYGPTLAQQLEAEPEWVRPAEEDDEPWGSASNPAA